ncbi:serine hydroxymethyltransferase, partial [Acetobacter sicerae]|nr:serine hydroxymethyltransferase [Acetobacter sicerae]MCE0745495.1 serine hydroxymethyltransferase [Acetobacter sicerae]
REAEFREVGEMIDEVLTALAAAGGEGDAAVENAVHERVKALCAKFPIYKK